LQLRGLTAGHHYAHSCLLVLHLCESEMKLVVDDCATITHTVVLLIHQIVCNSATELQWQLAVGIEIVIN